MAVFKEIGDFCETHRNDEAMAPYTKAIKKGLNDAQASTMWFMQNAMAKPDNAAPALPTTCISSGSSCSATCGA